MLEDLKQQVCRANLELDKAGLSVLTWGNVSGMDRDTGLFAIKPSGVPYSELEPAHIVLVDLEGKIAEGKLKPSSDAPTHRILYREFPMIAGVTHSHSTYATMFAQAGKEIPCYGTTHADQYFGSVPLVRVLKENEVVEAYEANTGRVIAQHFHKYKIDPEAMPAALCAFHGPFTWGRSPADSVQQAVALEAVARMAFGTRLLNPETTPIPGYLQNKHYQRKHGPDAYYGQKT